jgi:hypothetical protein
VSHKPSPTLFALVILISAAITTVAFRTPPQAQSVPLVEDENKCLSCHENLYFLHDTGNWFCLRESPMLCVDCHGGNPEAITQEAAHTNRAAHPVINEDLSKCQECHPEECYERVEIFDQRAGISDVLVALPYTPAYSSEQYDTTATGDPEQDPSELLMYWEIIPLVLVAGLALGIYFIARGQHN